MLPSILELSRSEFDTFLDQNGQPPYRTDQVFKAVYSKNLESFDQFSTLPKSFRGQLAEQFSLRSFNKIDQVKSQLDDTTKFLWELPDGQRIESVIIYEGNRTTFCISSQVGCPLDCKFCATGKMGLLRNLTKGEIVEQVLQMKALSMKPPTNIVFMGMGEPLLNYDNVIAAAHVISDPEGLCFNRRKITISTSGVIKNIYRMADEKVPFPLAISLNSVDQEVRQQIMPISKKYPIDQLLEAARYYTEKMKKRVTFEYVLIKNVNATVADAKKLVSLTHSIPCKINIIPCNSIDPQYQPPSEVDIFTFDQIVNKKNRTIMRRNRKGWEIQAACGQLYAKNPSLKTKKVNVAAIDI